MRQNPPPQIRRRQVPGAPLPHPEPPWDPRGGWGEGRRIWGVFGRFGASGGGGSAGTPPDVACGHLPTPNPPQNRRKTATIGRFHRFGRFSPPKNKKKLTGCVWGGGLVGVFCSPRRPCPRQRSLREPEWGKKTPKTGSAGDSREPEIGICAAFTPKWAIPGMEGEGELWDWLLSPPKKRPQNCL